jgi:hypothetical protein
MQNENEGESLLDAINAGIPSEEPQQEEETPLEETDETEALPEGEEGDAGEAADGEEGDDAGAEGEEGEQTDEEKAAAAAKAAKPAKEADPINDPLPRGTLQSTAERFKHVVDKLKEQTAARETVETQYNEIIGEITGAGMDGNTFGHMLEYARGVNGGTYEGLRKSWTILQNELKALSEALGEPMPGEDILKNYPDLLKEVNDKLITPERASEIARQRNRDAAQAKLGQAKQTTQQSAAQQAQAVTAGKAALTALGKELAGKDGAVEYRRKAGLVVGMLQSTFQHLPPAQWAKAFRAAYAQVPAAPKAAAKSGAKPGERPQPLRGNKVPSGQSSKQPKTMQEAISAAFE